MASTTAWAAAGSPGRPPIPRTPSRTRSAPASSSPARGSTAAPREVTTSTPAERTASSARGWTWSATATTAAAAPWRARSATAYRASPPLLPAPTTATTRSPLDSRARTTAARPEAARCISSPSGSVAIRASSAARTSATAYALIMGGSPFGDDDRGGDAGVVRQRHVQGVHAQVVGAGLDAADDLQVRTAVVALVDGDVAPVQTGGGAERLGERLLRGEPGSERAQSEPALDLGEEPLLESGRALEGLPEPLDVHDVDADAEDHAARPRVRPVTVTRP